MSDPRRAEVWGKKPEVADRTLNERKFCKVCDYYYSEMFTCPICFGADRERERIFELAWDWISEMRGHDGDCSCRHEATILQQFIEHVDFKGEQK